MCDCLHPKGAPGRRRPAAEMAGGGADMACRPSSSLKSANGGQPPAAVGTKHMPCSYAQLRLARAAGNGRGIVRASTTRRGSGTENIRAGDMSNAAGSRSSGITGQRYGRPLCRQLPQTPTRVKSWECSTQLSQCHSCRIPDCKLPARCNSLDRSFRSPSSWPT